MGNPADASADVATDARANITNARGDVTVTHTSPDVRPNDSCSDDARSNNERADDNCTDDILTDDTRTDWRRRRRSNRMVRAWNHKPEQQPTQMLSSVLRYMWWEWLRRSRRWRHVLPSEDHKDLRINGRHWVHHPAGRRPP